MANQYFTQNHDSAGQCKGESSCLYPKERSCIPSFISKTFEILEVFQNSIQKEDHSELISWSENGLSFYVKNIKQFQEKILPVYFRHKNFASFVRQLNMYDFHKVRGEQKHIFSHKLFQRDQKQILSEIKRKCFKKNRQNSEEDIVEESVEDKNENLRKETLKEIVNSVRVDSRCKQKKQEMMQLQKSKRTIIQAQNQKAKERNLELMNQIITRLSKTHPQSDREIRDKINWIMNDPKYSGISNKCYIYNIYKRLRENLFQFRPRNTLEQLDQLSIEEDIIYNQIDKPSKFKIASLTNFQTENLLNRSDKEVYKTITGEDYSRDFF